MEQCVLKIVNDCFNTNIYSSLETSVVNVIKHFVIEFYDGSVVTTEIFLKAML
jgi:hypothetical protein